MRIAYLVADQGIPYHGTKGASVHVQGITEALAGLGHEVTCFVARRGEEPDTPGPVDVRLVRLDPFLKRLADGASRSGSGSRVHAVRKKELTGLCLNDPFERTVETEHRSSPFDLLLERYSLWSFCGARLARRLGIPFLLEVNAPLPEEQRRFRLLELSSVARSIQREVFREATGIVAVSREVARGAVQQGADRARVVVVPNGYDPRLIQPVENRNGEEARFTVGFVGSLRPWHGVETLCRAFARFARSRPGARLLLVGDGPMKDWVRSFAAAGKLSHRIELTGNVPRADVPAQLARIHLAAAPYSEASGFYFSPLKVFEYMGAGLPIVASAVGQLAEILEHGRTAWLVPPGDPEALAAAMQHLAADRSLRRSLGTASAREARKRFRWEDTALHVLDAAQRAAAMGEASRG